MRAIEAMVVEYSGGTSDTAGRLKRVAPRKRWILRFRSPVSAVGLVWKALKYIAFVRFRMPGGGAATAGALRCGLTGRGERFLSAPDWPMTLVFSCCGGK